MVPLTERRPLSGDLIHKGRFQQAGDGRHQDGGVVDACHFSLCRISGGFA
jgi:hypothetical protein